MFVMRLFLNVKQCKIMFTYIYNSSTIFLKALNIFKKLNQKQKQMLLWNLNECVVHV